MRLIDADALKERIQSKYTFAIASEIGYEIDKMPTELHLQDDNITHLISEFDGVIYNTAKADFVCVIDPCMPDKSSQFLMRTENGDYFTCKTAQTLTLTDGIKNHINYFDVRPTTLDDADDYIMEFYPEEYDRIKPILDAEREKSVKNKKE